MTRKSWIAVLYLVLAVGCVSVSCAADKSTIAYEAGPVFVRLTTDAGPILLEMRHDLAPHHVENFIHLGATGFYDGTVFHRIIPGFMIQGGDPNSRDDDPSDDGQGGPRWSDVLSPSEQVLVRQVADMLAAKGYAGLAPRAELKAEFSETHHGRGALSMARSRNPDSAGSQFFICVADAPHLDGQYTYFGQVVLGLDVADAIVSAPRNARDYPDEPVKITDFTVIDDTKALTAEERAAWQAMQSRGGIPE